MSKKPINEKCPTCKYVISGLLTICLNCNNFNKWEAEKTSPSLPEDYTMNCFQPCVYEALVRMYDRYMEVILTAPIKDDSLNTMNMDQFFNHILVRGLVGYGEFLMPMEIELGII